MSKKRPVNLDLMSMRFPATAIASILHRISGLLLFLAIPVLLYYFQCSLANPTQFDYILSCLSTPIAKFIVWLLGSGLIYHIVAGIRHLIMDAGIGEEKQSGRIGAWLVMISSGILIVLLAGWIWL